MAAHNAPGAEAGTGGYARNGNAPTGRQPGEAREESRWANRQANSTALAQALLSAAQNALRKHILATGAAPRAARAGFTVRTAGGTAAYTVVVKRVAGGGGA